MFMREGTPRGFSTMSRGVPSGRKGISSWGRIPNVGEDALKDLDEHGIIRVGAEIRAGDYLVGKVTPKGEAEATAEEKLLRAIFGEKAREVRDTSLKVPHGEEDVAAQGDLTLVGGGAVGQHGGVVHLAAGLIQDHAVDPLAHVHDGALGDAGEDQYFIGQATEPVDEDGCLVNERVTCRHRNETISVDRRRVDYVDVSPILVLLAGGHHGGLGAEQGHGLALHVGAHQGAVSVVVLEEGDHGGSHRYHHLGGDVHIVHCGLRRRPYQGLPPDQVSALQPHHLHQPAAHRGRPCPPGSRRRESPRPPG